MRKGIVTGIVAGMVIFSGIWVVGMEKALRINKQIYQQCLIKCNQNEECAKECLNKTRKIDNQRIRVWLGN